MSVMTWFTEFDTVISVPDANVMILWSTLLKKEMTLALNQISVL